MVRAAGHDVPGAGHDLDPATERALSALIKERHGHEFVFVTDYPAAVRAFYHMRHDDDPTLTKSFDLLWRGIEVTTGAQREHRRDRLLAQAADRGHRRRADRVLPGFLPLRLPSPRRVRLRPDAPADADARPGQASARSPSSIAARTGSLPRTGRRAPAGATRPMARILISTPMLEGCLGGPGGTRAAAPGSRALRRLPKGCSARRRCRSIARRSRGCRCCG